VLVIVLIALCSSAFGISSPPSRAPKPDRRVEHPAPVGMGFLGGGIMPLFILEQFLAAA